MKEGQRHPKFLLALGLACTLLFLLSGSRERPWGDARPIFDVAEAIVTRGAVNIPTRWPEYMQLGKDGKTYAAAPLLQSLVHLPGAALYHAIIRVAPAAGMYTLPVASHLAPAALGGCVCVLFFLLCRRERISPAGALLATVALATCTTLWVYARSTYSEVLQAACFTGFFLALLAAADAPDRRRGIALGVAAGLLVNAKLTYLLALPGAAVFLAWRAPDRRALLRTIGWAALAAAPLVLIIVGYNYARWGSAFETGYNLKLPVFEERLLWGLWGILLSPGKSALLYSPPLLLALGGLSVLWRARRSMLAALALTVAPLLLLNGKMLYWAGDFAWGPRYFVFAVPVLMLPAAAFIDTALRSDGAARRWRMAILAVVLGAGFGIQLLGNAFYWDHFIRIARDASHRWLGEPNRLGATRPREGDGGCGACFEDMSAMQWLPPFQPIVGHAWLLRHVVAGHDWIVAEADAPWRRYTTLRLDISETYPRARVDWWFLDFVSGPLVAGLVLLGLLTAGLVGAVVTCVASLRRSRPAPSS